KFDNHVTGGAGDDLIDLTPGGNDHAEGGDGDDTILMGSKLNKDDIIDGGAGNDAVVLAGDYSNGLVFSATMMVNVETLTLGAGNDYKLTMADANVAAHQVLTVDGSGLGANDTLVFNGAKETDGGFHVLGGKANDTLTGGDGNDVFDLSFGGDDTAQ